MNNVIDFALYLDAMANLYVYSPQLPSEMNPRSP